jgi:hypothetical protein
MVVDELALAGPTVTDVAVQTDEEGLATAALKLDAALTTILSPSLQPPPVEQLRMLKLAAGDVLRALGFRHASARADAMVDKGATEVQCSDNAVEHIEAAEMTEARTVANASTRRDDELAQVLDEANRMSAVAATWEKVEQKRRSASGRPDLETDLETLLLEVQAEDEKLVDESQWPIRLPAFWYNDDPKRAIRAILRNVHGRDYSKNEVDWWTWEVPRPSRAGQAVRPQHVCVARFPVWHTWFKRFCGQHGSGRGAVCIPRCAGPL